MKCLFFSFLISVLFFSFWLIVPSEPQAGPAINNKEVKDERIALLEAFFQKYNSPLERESANFVSVADRAGIPWKLLPSVSCVESSCGKHYPAGTFNIFGWASGNHTFSSYSHAISLVAYKLTTLPYYRAWQAKKEDIGLLSKIYCPPNAKNWEAGVKKFMGEIK